MRVLLAVAVLGGVAHADVRRECHLQDAAVTTTDLGCFEYSGGRVCLIRSDTNVCSGVVFMDDGSPTHDPQILDRATCGGTGDSVTFKGSWVMCRRAGRCSDIPLSFTGVLDGERLRGTFSLKGQKGKVTWKKAKAFDTRAHLVKARARTCKTGVAPPRPRPSPPPGPEFEIPQPPVEL